MIDDSADLIRAAGDEATVYVIADNRAWGNAPNLLQTVARRVMDTS